MKGNQAAERQMEKKAGNNSMKTMKVKKVMKAKKQSESFVAFESREYMPLVNTFLQNRLWSVSFRTVYHKKESKVKEAEMRQTKRAKSATTAL